MAGSRTLAFSISTRSRTPATRFPTCSRRPRSLLARWVREAAGERISAHTAPSLVGLTRDPSPATGDRLGGRAALDGVRNEDHVVVYDTSGINSACRVYWTFKVGRTPPRSHERCEDGSSLLKRPVKQAGRGRASIDVWARAGVRLGWRPAYLAGEKVSDRWPRVAAARPHFGVWHTRCCGFFGIAPLAYRAGLGSSGWAKRDAAASGRPRTSHVCSPAFCARSSKSARSSDPTPSRLSTLARGHGRMRSSVATHEQRQASGMLIGVRPCCASSGRRRRGCDLDAIVVLMASPPSRGPCPAGTSPVPSQSRRTLCARRTACKQTQPLHGPFGAGVSNFPLARALGQPVCPPAATF